MTDTVLLVLFAGAVTLIIMALISLAARGRRLLRTATRITNETAPKIDDLLQQALVVAEQTEALNEHQNAIEKTSAHLLRSLGRLSIARNAISEGTAPIRSVRSYINK